MEDDREMARIPPDAILDAALEVCDERADALFISCTALRAVEIIERAGAALTRPVLSAIQTLFWQSLREAGCSAPVPGFGRLLASREPDRNCLSKPLTEPWPRSA